MHMLKRHLLLLLALAALLGVASSPASALDGPGWQLNARTYPTNLPPGGGGALKIDLYNIGAAASTGVVSVVDTLPAGVTATAAGAYSGGEVRASGWDCAGIGSQVVTCTSRPGELPGVPVDSFVAVGIAVDVAPGTAGTPSNQVTVTGGGVPSPASITDPLSLSAAPAGFGLADFDGWFANADGSIDQQAGSHPYEITIAYDMNNVTHGGVEVAGSETRNIDVNLPPGLVGDPNAVPRCPRQQFDARRCPPVSQIGIANVDLAEEENEFPVYDVVPPPGVPAQFGFDLLGNEAFLDAGVRSGGDYGITEHVDDIVQRQVTSSSVTLWGVPGEASHDALRLGPGCHSGCASGAAPKPLLTLPSSCVGPQLFTLAASAWLDPNLTAAASFTSHDANGTPAGFSGCERLGFDPSISIAPDTSQAGTPAGLTVDLRMPQEGLGTAGGLAASDLKDTVVTLPRGVVVNPGQAAGLAACQPSEDGVGTEGPPSCPAASRIGSDEISTPLLADKLQGNVYVLQSNPPDLKLLVAASGDGVDLKLVGDVHLDQATGQLTTTFKETPELPFTDFKLSFDGGPQAALVTPSVCGSYTTSTDFTPWATPFLADVLRESSFAVQEGVEGTACGGAAAFAPAMVAGTVSNQAAAFSPLSVTFSRRDQDQDLGGVSLRTPPGLLALLKGVERCGEPQAGLGTCGPGSLIGHATVGAGPGPDPLYVQGGQVFLTGPYKGAPFGLSIVVPAVAGPFNLGNVITRAAVNIDPHTAQVTVTSDPLPTILDGIPLQLKTVNVTIDRTAFMFNPTSCETLAVDGTLTSTQGASASVSSRFQAANCATLPFHPVFSVSTQARTSKKNGASLDVKASFPAGAPANIRKVAVVLPKQLPARLTTIQQACPQAVFAANPASCPAGSAIGTGIAKTPILAGPLTGPAYLVSHGGAAFPDVVVVLQGEGVTVDLTGAIDIKKGVTSSTFASVPDAPISSFELKLPQGPHSGLAAVVPAKAKGNLCGQSLAMPIAITGQNGAQIKQNAKIAVSGCPKAKKKAQKGHKASKHKKHAKASRGSLRTGK